MEIMVAVLVCRVFGLRGVVRQSLCATREDSGGCALRDALVVLVRLLVMVWTLLLLFVANAEQVNLKRKLQAAEEEKKQTTS